LAVEGSNKVVESEAVLGIGLEAADVQVAVNQLSLLCHDINLVFILRHGHTHNVVVPLVGKSFLRRHLNSRAIGYAAQRHTFIIIRLGMVEEEVVGDGHDDTLIVRVDALDVLT